MAPFKHILVPVDFGAAMQPAIELAVSLARRTDAHITLLNVFDITPFTSTSPFAAIIDVEPLIAAAESELQSLLAKVHEQWPKSEAVLYRGPAHEAILEAVKARGCDLLLLGTHGRAGMARAFMGSVAERIVRASPVPVLTVHPAQHDT